MAQRFLQLAEVSEVLNISAAQAYALVRSGELPAIKVGGRASGASRRASSRATSSGCMPRPVPSWRRTRSAATSRSDAPRRVRLMLAS